MGRRCRRLYSSDDRLSERLVTAFFTALDGNGSAGGKFFK